MSPNTVIRGENLSFAQVTLLVIEGLTLLCIAIAFWYHIDPSQALRDAWFWLLWFAVPIFGLRHKLFGRLWTHTPLHDLLVLFIILAAFNNSQATYHRESFLAVMARPLFGMWISIFFIELARATRRLKEVVVIMIVISSVLGILALTSSQWLESKTSILWEIITFLPRFDYRMTANALEGQVCSPLVDIIHVYQCFNPATILRNSLLSFNVNEIAGVLSWLTPLMAGFAFIPIGSEDMKKEARFWIIIRSVSACVFALLFLALFFGQSRFAIMGVFIVLGVMSIIAIPKSIWRYVALGVVGIMTLLQVGIFLNVFDPVPIANTTNETIGLSVRDETSVATRLEIWQRGVDMMLDAPFTGVGMYMFRTAISRDPYRIPYYVENNIPSPPHAHNEWINIGAEMGLLGLGLFISLQAIVLYMLWYGWKHGDTIIRAVAIATGAGFIAHAIYGLGDTIALWDRFQFVLWCLIGLAGAQYVLARIKIQATIWDADIDVI